MEVKGYSLAILGDSGVGKTSFSNRYTQNMFNSSERSTIGAEYFQKIFYYYNQSIKLDIYGTSGNEKYKKISKYLYKDARSIIIMYKISDENSFHNLKNYLDDIRQNSVENPIIYLVGNFSDVRKESRQVNFDELKSFAQEQELKCFEISCKNGNGINEVITELTREILVTGKWYISKIFKDLGDISALEKAEKENDKLKKHLKTFIKEKKPTFLRCQACDKLFIVRFRMMFNEVAFICNNCKFETSIPISSMEGFIENLSNRIACNECKKKVDKHKLNYCPKCKEYICSSCEKNHEKKIKASGGEVGHSLCPYYLMDISCFKDSKKNIGYCKFCKQSFCSKCNNDHKKHEFMYFDDFIEQLTKESRDNIQKESSLINEFKKNCEDCLETLKRTINHFINIKEKEIKLKEQLLFQLSNIQYNYQLIETVKNLRYIKTLKYDRKSFWDQKLTDIFEVLGLPIEIKSINISKDKNTSITPEKIRIGYNVDTPLVSEIKEITDICSMNNDKYLGVSFNNGTLELYDNLIKSREPLSVFRVFENEQTINSIQKSTRNLNNFFICGQYKIKNIEFYDNYKSYKTINELVDEEKIFMLCLEQNDYMLTCDVFNHIELFSKENKKLEDISDCIDPTGSKRILSFNEISNDKIYINYNRLSESNDDILRGRNSTMSSSFDIDNFTIDLAESGNSIKQQIELGTKIIEINYNRIKREYNLPNKQEIIGVLNDKLILIRDEVNGSVILFDVNTFKNSQRFYWDLGGKPIYIGALNRRLNLIDFILVDDRMNIFQNIYDEETKTMTQISGLKNKNEGLEIDSEIFKRGKIIQNPFKSVINYIGDNDFIVVNY
jgi:small GTP-binding protein